MESKDWEETCLKVEEAFTPACPYKDALNEHLYIYTDEGTRTFILHRSISTLYKDMNRGTKNDKTSTKEN